LRDIIGRQQPAVTASADIQHVRVAKETVHRLGNETAVPGVAGGLDADLARRTDSLAHQAFIGVRQRRAGEQAAGSGDLAVRQEDRGRTGPFLLEQRLHSGDRCADARHDMHAVARVADGVCEHIGEFPGPPVAQHQAPGVECTRNDRRQQPGRRNELHSQIGKLLRCGGGRGNPLAADDMLPPAGRAVQDDRCIAAGAVQVRLGDVQSEARGNRGIEGVAAALQHRHADLAGEPVGAGDDAEGAGDFRPSGEHGARPPECG
jgi:hypothetical protein